MTFSSQPSPTDVARRLMAEATAQAQALGHSINGFSETDMRGKLGACCEACFDWAFVSLARRETSGPAVALPCKPQKPPEPVVAPSEAETDPGGWAPPPAPSRWSGRPGIWGPKTSPCGQRFLGLDIFCQLKAGHAYEHEHTAADGSWYKWA